MSERLQIKLDLAQRSIRVGASILIQQKLWKDVQELALNENDERLFDTASKVLECPRYAE